MATIEMKHYHANPRTCKLSSLFSCVVQTMYLDSSSNYKNALGCICMYAHTVHNCLISSFATHKEVRSPEALLIVYYVTDELVWQVIRTINSPRH